MNRNILIFGDSYSTFKDCIPEGYSYYYSEQGRGEDNPVSRMHREETWWARLIERGGYTLVLNDSWSGSTVSYTGYNGDCSKTNSFIFRYRGLRDSGFFRNNEIDTVLFFGATNDSWCPSPLGEMKFSDFEESDLYCVRPAICYMISEIKSVLPHAEIVIMLNSDIISSEIAECMRLAAEHFGVKLLPLPDIDKMNGHPTVLGMQQISERIYELLEG